MSNVCHFVQNNVPAHSARVSEEYLASLAFKDEKIILQQTRSPDVNPIKKWVNIKRKAVHIKQELWLVIKTVSNSVDAATIKQLNESANKRFSSTKSCNGRHIQ